jgi:drug/metabolite transporter (DMT)-like permease
LDGAKSHPGRRSPVSRGVSQYHYTQLVTGTLVSYLIWRDKPGFYVLLGGTLILASGLYIAVTAREMLPITGSPVE